LDKLDSFRIKSKTKNNLILLILELLYQLDLTLQDMLLLTILELQHILIKECGIMLKLQEIVLVLDKVVLLVDLRDLQVLFNLVDVLLLLFVLLV